jgi:hypothetical protein
MTSFSGINKPPFSVIWMQERETGKGTVVCFDYKPGSKNISRKGPRNCRCLYATLGQVGFPDFLSRVAASIDCMWFSLRRTTYVVAVESDKGEIRVRSFENQDDKGGVVKRGRAVTKGEQYPSAFGTGAGAPQIPRLRSG